MATGCGGSTGCAVGLAAHANWMHRFRGAGLGGSEVGAGVGCASTWTAAERSETVLVGGGASPPCRRSDAISGRGGLGVLVRAGLVSPVSLVRSAVEAMLTLDVMERRRGRVVGAGRGVAFASSSFCPAIALVSDDCSLGRRIAVLVNRWSFWRNSGGSSRSPRSSLLSPAHVGALNVGALVAMMVMMTMI